MKSPTYLIIQITLKALVDCGHVDDLLRLAIRWHVREIPEDHIGHTMNSGKYLSATACWALGYTEPTKQITEFLFRVLSSTESDISEQLMSSEALLRLRVPTNDHLDDITQLIERCQNSPFLIKI